MIWHIIFLIVFACFLFRVIFFLNEKTAFAHRYHKRICTYADIFIMFETILLTPLTLVMGTFYLWVSNEVHPLMILIVAQCLIAVVLYIAFMVAIDKLTAAKHPRTRDYVQTHGYFPSANLD